MGFRKISRDVKIAAIRIWQRHLLQLDQILECLDFSEQTWFCILKLWHETGDLVRQNPDYFLDELLHLLQTNRLISMHYTTIHRELERAGVSCKKLKKIAMECSKERRAEFILRMAHYEPEELAFLDETSKDERTCARHYGQGRKGKRAEKKQVFVRGRRTLTTGVLTLNGIEAATVVEGSMTRDLFLQFLEYTVLPKCTPYPGLLSVLVMDNAKIHHGDQILELADRFGVHIKYLPPYSPDFNPIEEAFSKIKHFLWRHQDYYSATQGDGIFYNMLEVVDIITPEDAEGYYIHSGYF
ncbi:hypothetical protein EWM64_g5286 [Hericium alpestre]|uniref:Tc1-like transposase DDE domain-containing protein n=1 Tax=Hericium alpestre TaxID=135208 RepID=A0A4Y9ZV03_9AGAM|nr:hypothetical protein EWM64_g5286 [Hericium alpestre]